MTNCSINVGVFAYLFIETIVFFNPTLNNLASTMSISFMSGKNRSGRVKPATVGWLLMNPLRCDTKVVIWAWPETLKERGRPYEPIHCPTPAQNPACWKNAHFTTRLRHALTHIQVVRTQHMDALPTIS